MTVIRHELKMGRLPLLIWTGVIGVLLAICVLLYPEMKGQIGEIGDMFASMGSFTEAFGMDQMDFGTLIGYYAIECGNVLGLGGAFYASLLAITALSGEEKDGTAEFLLTHPVSRKRILTEKLISIVIRVTAMNLLILALALGSMALIGEAIPWGELLLLHLAYYILQLELAGICFGISAFAIKGSVGFGLGVAVLTYFLNIVANITESAEFLKYVTPFGYCDGAAIVNDLHLDGVKLAIGMAVCAAGVAVGYIKYTRKDIH